MAIINSKEVLTIASLSGIRMDEGDAQVFTGQIQKVLSFIDELPSATISQVAPLVSAVNVLRPDIHQSLDATSPLEQAPESHDGYFVVPKMLEDTKGSV